MIINDALTDSYCIPCNLCNYLFMLPVTGEANFSMDSTCLTVGGFSQPSVAHVLIEQNGSAEIGLSQRILWLFPQPAYSRFCTLEAVNSDFTDSLGMYRSSYEGYTCVHNTVLIFF